MSTPVRNAKLTGGNVLTGNQTLNDLTASRALVLDASKNVTASSTTDTEIGYVNGVTSAIQTQINGKVALAGDTMTGQLNFSGTNHAGIKLISLTTAQRDALTPANGMAIYNTTTNAINGYVNGAWTELQAGDKVDVAGDTMTGELAINRTNATCLVVTRTENNAASAIAAELVADDSGTNDVEYPLYLRRMTTGTAASGIGCGILIATETDAGGAVTTGVIEARLTNVASGTPVGEVAIKVVNTTLSEVVKWTPTEYDFSDGYNFKVGTTTGTKIGTATTQKLGFWNATPIVQPSTTGTVTGYTGGGGTALTHSDTFTGNTGTKAYTIGDIVKALKDAGIMAAS